MTCRYANRPVALVATLVLIPLLASCAGAPPATSLAPTEEQMIGHYGRFSEIQSSLVMGDLAAAQSAARSLTRSQMPPTTTRWVQALQDAASDIAAASDMEGATQASGALVQACGSCHESVDARPNVRFVAGAPRGASRDEHMARDMWALDQLMDGMVSGDNEYWMNGAGVLADDDDLGALGQQALAATGEQRAVVYGWVLKSCADCHTR